MCSDTPEAGAGDPKPGPDGVRPQALLLGQLNDGTPGEDLHRSSSFLGELQGMCQLVLAGRFREHCCAAALHPLSPSPCCSGEAQRER